VLEQPAADSLTGGDRVHRDLLDMHVAVDQIGDQVGDRAARAIVGDPGAALSLVAGELGQGQRLIVGDLPHVDLREHRSGRPLDFLHDRKIVLDRSPDAHRAIIACRLPPGRQAVAIGYGFLV
jgi:hypothetical protein